ncbi:hypothetical protein QJS04_geneDACA019929 [Acorus gramineus]|uniref:DNA/RNA-binding protein Alba-like domain-containing protein n=1 Tax=Acorus gramineus TaxID=55184 RepID=A0AAV9AFJ1_ACOGR|nr:hypothetical protein QJS04_geneDACA019929 [Acorus gramineus]
MDRYQRVEKPREATPINENEIRITAQGRMRNYITYATSLLQEKGSNEIVLKAMGRAINKTVMIAELIKRRIVGLHQNTSVGSTDITDTWEPLEEGLLPLETTRHVSMITITLSKNELDTSSPGGRRGGRGRGRGDYYGDGGYEGGRGGYEGVRGGYEGGRGGYEGGRGGYEGGRGGYEGGRGYGGGRGRGRGRGRGGFRGRGRGGYGGGEMQQESGGYDDYGGNDVPPPQGRGKCINQT